MLDIDSDFAIASHGHQGKFPGVRKIEPQSAVRLSTIQIWLALRAVAENETGRIDIEASAQDRSSRGPRDGERNAVFFEIKSIGSFALVAGEDFAEIFGLVLTRIQVYAPNMDFV